MLEFVTSTIGPWIDLIENNLPPLTCILSMTDSTTSAGWLKKSNFQDEEDEDSKVIMACKQELARDHALRLLTNDIKEYSQWFPGSDNIVADSLSRDFHIEDIALTNLLRLHCHSQLPPHFAIAPLPQEIESFLCAWMLKMPARQPSQEQRTRSNIGLGHDGPNSSKQLNLTTTHSSNLSTYATGQKSSAVSHNRSGPPNLLLELSSPWLRAQSEMPWTTWLRPSGMRSLMTQDSKKEGISLHAFYRDSTKAMQTRTHPPNNKKQQRQHKEKSREYVLAFSL